MIRVRKQYHNGTKVRNSPQYHKKTVMLSIPDSFHIFAD